MKIYRISPCKFNKDINGTGAAMNGGRWNSKGIYVTYASLTSSLALLETVAHLSEVPVEDYCIATIHIPDHKIRELTENDLPSDWNEYPAPEKLKTIGDQFIFDNRYLALILPSAVFKFEKNILLNPMHNDFDQVKLVSSEKIIIDERLLIKNL